MQESRNSIANFLGSTAVKTGRYLSDQPERSSAWFFRPSARSQRNINALYFKLAKGFHLFSHAIGLIAGASC
jgi:hypothetical protein